MENTVQATEGMQKIAENAMVKKVATIYCDGEEGSDGCMKLVAVRCLWYSSSTANRHATESVKRVFSRMIQCD